MTDLALILAAVLLAAAGGEAFLKSIIGAALHLRVPKLVVATTLAAFATSSPELTVSSLAALAGKPEIGLGDALGSNVVNIGLILGVALLFGALSARFGEIKRCIQHRRDHQCMQTERYCKRRHHGRRSCIGLCILGPAL